MERIAIFASGTGTNAQNLIRYFNFDNPRSATVAAVFVNNPDAPVIQRALVYGVPVYTFSKRQLELTDDVLTQLHRRGITFIVLAGFLLHLPDNIIDRYYRRVVNLHPSLLPKYGGKGMYGRRVHSAVLEAKESVTGITVHIVNHYYDEGEITMQKTVDIDPDESVDSLEQKIHELELEFFPKEIERLIQTCC